MKDLVDAHFLPSILPPKDSDCGIVDRLAWRTRPQVSLIQQPSNIRNLCVVLDGAQIAVCRVDCDAMLFLDTRDWTVACEVGNEGFAGWPVSAGFAVLAGTGALAAAIPDRSRRGEAPCWHGRTQWKRIPIVIENDNNYFLPDYPDVLGDDSVLYNESSGDLARVTVVRDADGVPLGTTTVVAYDSEHPTVNAARAKTTYTADFKHTEVTPEEDPLEELWSPEGGGRALGPSVPEDCPPPMTWERSYKMGALPDAPIVDNVNAAVLAEHPSGSDNWVIVAAQNSESGDFNVVLDPETLTPLGNVPNTSFESEPGMGFDRNAGLIVQTVSYPSGIVALTPGGRIAWAHSGVEVSGFGGGVVMSRTTRWIDSDSPDADNGKLMQTWARLANVRDGHIVNAVVKPEGVSSMGDDPVLDAHNRRIFFSSSSSSTFAVAQF